MKVLKLRYLEPQQRLIVAADFTPEGEDPVARVYNKVLTFAQQLRELGVIIKVNFPLRAYGYSLIDQLRDMGLKVFADLKLIDVKKTMYNDGILLADAQPDLVTVKAEMSTQAIQALKASLGQQTEILGVTVLTDIGDSESRAIYGCDVDKAAPRLATHLIESDVDGLICSAQDIPAFREAGVKLDGITLNCAGIRPEWAPNPAGQVRITTPTQAIQAGATRIVVGGPIVNADDPIVAAQRVIDEIAAAQRKEGA
jgi:orotidine-5'-phosphate decarboxylase